MISNLLSSQTQIDQKEMECTGGVFSICIETNRFFYLAAWFSKIKRFYNTER